MRNKNQEKENWEKIILDLCGGTGSWSKPYKKAGYDVRNITLPEFDILKTEILEKDIVFAGEHRRSVILKNKVYGILAAPPCTMFSLARTNAKKPRDLKEGFEVVNACLNIIWSCMEIQQDTKRKTLPLRFWALENPNGMLKYFLGKPAFEFNPYEFGHPYKKKTYLWGWFNEPKKENPIESKQPKFDMILNKDLAEIPEGYKRPEEMTERQIRRSITPKGFAEAFFDSNR